MTLNVLHSFSGWRAKTLKQGAISLNSPRLRVTLFLHPPLISVIHSKLSSYSHTHRQLLLIADHISGAGSRPTGDPSGAGGGGGLGEQIGEFLIS